MSRTIFCCFDALGDWKGAKGRIRGYRKGNRVGQRVSDELPVCKLLAGILSLQNLADMIYWEIIPGPFETVL